ncbi:MAG: GatB/YqeY domain-containing protein [Candidatus Sungbacteria bacterium]|nr:GatB/YqeY domain-containing protein [Candidatus Sungbacteria bacterium]
MQYTKQISNGVNLKTTIEDAARHALKNQEPELLGTLRMLLAAFKNREIEKRAKTGELALTEEEAVILLRSEAKKRKDAMAEFQKGGRSDLAEHEGRELITIEQYLPPELSDADIEKIVRDVAGTPSTATKKDFGKVMGMVMQRVKGQASGERVSAVLNKFLQ